MLLIFNTLSKKNLYWYIQSRMIKGFGFISLLLISTMLFAQTVQDFSALNVADNKMVSLNSFQNCDGLVVLFTSNTCPYDNYYTDRIHDLVEKYKGRIQFLLVNSFVEPKENMKAMSAQYSQWKLAVPYLADKEQVVMDCLDAKKSAEAFLLERQNSSYVIFYRGAIDDNPQVASDVSRAYLQENIENLLAQRKVTDQNTRPVGCTIRKK